MVGFQFHYSIVESHARKDGSIRSVAKKQIPVAGHEANWLDQAAVSVPASLRG
jgi:hypothetical protein